MTIYGVDVSHYQTGFDMSAAKAQGISFAIVKVSQGSTYRDPGYAAHRDNARAAGLVLAAYHMITTESASAQAANCKAALGADTRMPVALDWESSGPSGDFNNALAVLHAFQAAGLNVVLGYFPKWYWQAEGSADMTSSGLPLWASAYVTGTGTPASLYPGDADAHWAGYGGLNVAVWQFTDTGTVAGTNLDCSAYRGSVADLQVLLNITAAPPTPTHHQGDPVEISLIYSGTGGVNFQGLCTAECGASSVCYARSFIKVASAWGAVTTCTISALNSSGLVSAQLTAAIPNNKAIFLEMPSGTCAATVEGTRAGGGVLVSASWMTIPY